MFDRPGVFLLTLLAGGASVLAGCQNCSNDPDVAMYFEMGCRYYETRKFDEAAGRFEAALKKCPDHYPSLIGLGNASREYGNQLYKGAYELTVKNKKEQAKKMFEEANFKHNDAVLCFQRAMGSRPDDMAPHVGLGTLCYQRATSPFPYPYLIEDRENRHRERDKAIEEFRLVVKKHPDTYQVRRYLGLALFAANQIDEGREHLKAYLDYLQGVFDLICENWPTATEENKKAREEALAGLDRDITEVRDVLTICLAGLRGEHDRILAVGRPLTPEEQKSSDRISREILATENTISSFSLNRFSPAEQELKDRCIQYLKSFNRGALAECLAFSAAEPGREEAVRRALEDKLGRGVRYGKMRYKAVAIKEDVGTVGLVCDVAEKGSVQPNVEVKIRWKLVSGQWKVVEHP